MSDFSLREPAFRPFPISAIRPAGWLLAQLRTQADGLSGHLDEFWPDIKDSAWIGGAAEGWERMPYWLDGVIPLAWLLGDKPLQGRVSGYLDRIFAGQAEDGWLGPRPEENPSAADVWSQALAMKMLSVWRAATGDPRVDGALMKAFRKLDRHIDFAPLGNWGKYRWQEFLIPLFDLYERHPEPFLIRLARRLRAQGFDWTAFFRDWPLTERTEQGRWNYDGHVVNNAQAIKTGSLWWRVTGDAGDAAAPGRMFELLMRHHGMPTGIFTGDETLAGLSPTQGTELCSVCEAMFSMETAAAVSGDALWGDRLERVAFNALPAAFSPDMWAHQYDQQVNQVECSNRYRPWTSNSESSNLFGLEPHFGCCTANLSQGWPKFAASLFMRSRDEDGEGVAVPAYAPAALEAEVGGVPVRVAVETGYPFRDEVRFTVVLRRGGRVPLRLRVPSWSHRATLVPDGGASRPLGRPGTFARLVFESETPRTFGFMVRLPADAIWAPNGDGSISLRRGPLLFALKMEERWTAVNQDKPFREPPHGDWEVRSDTPWNLAVSRSFDASLPAADGVSFEERPMPEGSTPFSPDAAPVVASVPVAPVPGWGADEFGNAAAVPASPVAEVGPASRATLVPYGCTDLRIAAFPWHRRKDAPPPSGA